MESIILEEKIDPNYEMTEEEYQEYLENLGITLPEDNDLLYLVQEALKAQLPEAWKPCQMKDGQVYYFNFDTGESMWDHPVDSLYREKIRVAKKNRKNQKVVQVKPEFEFNDAEQVKKEFGQWSEKVKQEYADKKDNEKKLIFKNLEEKKAKILAQFQEKEEKILKMNKAKIEKLRDELKRTQEEQEKGMLERLSEELSDQLKTVQELGEKSLEELKKKLNLRKKNAEIEEKEVEALNEKKRNIEKYKGKHLTETQVGEQLKTCHQAKLQKMRNRLIEAFESEKKKIDNIEIEAIPEDPQSVEEDLEKVKRELELGFSSFLKDLKDSNLKNYLQEENRILENKKKLTARIKEEVKAKEEEMRLRLEEDLVSYKKQKEAEKNHKLLKIKEDFLTEIREAEEKINTKKQTQEREAEEKLNTKKKTQEKPQNFLRNLQRKPNKFYLEIQVKNKGLEELGPKDSEFDSHSGESEFQSENCWTDKKQSPSVKESFSRSDFFNCGSVESDFESIKKSIFQSNSSQKDKQKLIQSINFEKNQIKTVKRCLQKKREKWQSDLKEYRASPSKKQFSELSERKKILEQKIKWHNWRIRELKILEKYLKSDDMLEFGSVSKLEYWKQSNAPVDTEIFTKSTYDVNKFKF